MGTLATVPISTSVAVETEDLEALRIALLLEPHQQVVAPTKFPAMGVPTTMDMVDGEEADVPLATASTARWVLAVSDKGTELGSPIPRSIVPGGTFGIPLTPCTHSFIRHSPMTGRITVPACPIFGSDT